MEYRNELILVDKRPGGVAVVTLNHPPLNVVTLPLIRELRETLLRVDRDGDIRCVVYTGSGDRAFSVGSDVKEFPEVWDDVVNKKLKEENEAFNLLELMSKPVIAAVRGVACGGGLEQALACDIRIMGDTARVALPEVNLGVFPASGGAFRLARLIGPGRALEMMYLGDFISAEECYRLGIANRVVPDGEVLDRAVEMAERIAQKSRDSIAVIKAACRTMWQQPTERCFWENLHYSDALFTTDNCKEGVAAFIEKRPARFNGRSSEARAEG